MTAQELFEAGRLTEAVRASSEEVRSHPSDPTRRFVLFALLCFAGDLRRAQLQLDALASQSPELELNCHVYGSLLAAEEERRGVAAGVRRPLLPSDPGPGVGRYLDALASLGAGEVGEAERLLDEGASQAVPMPGKIDGEAFDAIRDTDDFLAPVLEVLAAGRCLWLPFGRVRQLEIPPPESLLDLLWVPARLHDAEGDEALVHVPTLYAGSHEHEADELRLGRRTVWTDVGGGVVRGVGQKVLLSASGDAEREWGLLAVRSLEVSG